MFCSLRLVGGRSPVNHYYTLLTKQLKCLIKYLDEHTIGNGFDANLTKIDQYNSAAEY